MRSFVVRLELQYVWCLAALGSGAEFNAVILFYLLANGSLTALQFAWGAQLIRGYLFRSRREKEE